MKDWIKAALIRAIKTFFQSIVSLATVGTAITELDWKQMLLISATAFVLSVCTSLAGLPEVTNESEVK